VVSLVPGHAPAVGISSADLPLPAGTAAAATATVRASKCQVGWRITATVGAGHFLYVDAGGFSYGCDAREGIGGELGERTTPEDGAQDARGQSTRAVDGGHLAGRSAKSRSNPAQVTGLAGTDAAGLGGGVHREEHHAGSVDGRLHGGGDVEVAATAAGHNGIKAGFLDRQTGEVGIVPGGDASGIEIHHRDLNVRAAIGNWAGLRSLAEGADACRVSWGRRRHRLPVLMGASRPAAPLSPLAA